MSQKSVHRVVSGASGIEAFTGKLIEELRAADIPNEVIHIVKEDITRSGDLANVCVEAIIEKIQSEKIPGHFFMTVERGKYSTPQELEQAILDNEQDVSNLISPIFPNIKIGKGLVDIWEVNGIELGFSKPVPRKEIYQRAFNTGFGKLSGEDVILARIQCPDLNHRIGGMEPIPDSSGFLRLFELSKSHYTPYLAGGWDDPDWWWDPIITWLFSRPCRK